MSPVSVATQSQAKISAARVGRGLTPAGATEHKRTLPAHVVAATALAVAGVLSIWPTALLLWSLWTTDPLKSIGALVPLVSLLLLLRTWRALGWESEGSWWGLILLVLTIAAVHLRDGAVLELVVTPSWSITLPPHSLVAFAYASGMVLSFGGRRLWRAARFPMALMLLVNPVPHVFNQLVDLPLQHASAVVARGLAHGLGQRLTPDQLYLMFTPDFGMFIAPGCNGIRGSVTMGLIALVAGYLYRFRWRPWVAMVTGAVVLGYLFNLVRLCFLVGYYVVALHWPSLQGHAEVGDYCIGATLFFFATMLLFAAVRRVRPADGLRWPEPWLPGKATQCLHSGGHTARLQFGAVLSLLLLSAAPYARSWLTPGVRQTPPVVFPASIGSYVLRRTWPETLDTGQTLFQWAEYARPGATSAIAVGVSPVLGAHDTLLCHAARGERWQWQGPLPLPTAQGAVAFSGVLFDDGVTASLEASTLCTGVRCGQWSHGRRHFGLVYSRPDPHELVAPGSLRPTPVLLQVAMPSGAAEKVRRAMVQELRAFSASASFGAFTYRYHPL